MHRDQTTEAAGPESGGALVEINDSTCRLSAIAWLRERVVEAAGSLGVRGEIRVRVVDDGAMAAAHERWGGQAGTTDVLTFDLADAPGEGVIDADILVCLDEAERQARARGHGPERELLLYIVHGMLHCAGYDDHDPGSAAEMHRREDEILAAIGVGATYGGAVGERRESR